jgi:hypothetical protein
MWRSRISPSIGKGFELGPGLRDGAENVEKRRFRCARVGAKANIEPRPRGESRPMRRATAALVAFLVLSGCTREEARARLQDDIQADTIDIIHARFPCRSPDLHFFGYRFRVIQKGEYGDGDICWSFSTRQWSWRILPGQSLSRLNPRN